MNFSDVVWTPSDELHLQDPGGARWRSDLSGTPFSCRKKQQPKTAHTFVCRDSQRFKPHAGLCLNQPFLTGVVAAFFAKGIIFLFSFASLHVCLIQSLWMRVFVNLLV